MLNPIALVSLLAASLISSVGADPIPTAPGPGAVFKEGGQCAFTWTPDPTGIWKVMNVELMTGNNFAMVHLTTVASLDGTSSTETTFNYPCPQVKPNSAIYFYQFTSPASQNRTWTTRFAISDANGDTTPPAEKTQPGGGAIPWGTGALANPADAKPAPPNGGGTAGNGTVTTDSVPSSSVTITTASSPTSQARTVQVVTVTSSSSDNATAAAAPTSSTTSGAAPASPAALGAEAMARATQALVALFSVGAAFAVFL